MFAHALTHMIIRANTEFLWHYGHYHGIWKNRSARSASPFGNNDDDTCSIASGTTMQAVQPAEPFDAVLDEVGPVSAEEAKRIARNEKAKAKRDATALLKAEQKKLRPSNDQFQLDEEENVLTTTGNAINLAVLLRAAACCCVLLRAAAC
jgi:hypothetical protein